MSYYARFESIDGHLFRFDTRIYIDSRQHPKPDGHCVAAVVGKNPGSARPVDGGLWTFIDLNHDNFLPSVRRRFLEAYRAIGKPVPDGAFVRVWNLFYVCDADLDQAFAKLHECRNARVCESETIEVPPFTWCLWGPPEERLNKLKQRFLGRKGLNPFFFCNTIQQVVEGMPGLSDFARHTQGLRKDPIVRHLKDWLAREDEALQRTDRAVSCTESSIERCGPCSGSIQPECLPVASFGDASAENVQVATIGLNPALDEWTTNTGGWKLRSHRVATLFDYRVTARTELTDAHLADARARAHTYFSNKQREWHSYFEVFDGVLGRINSGWSYALGTAVHIDLVACATRQRFGKVSDTAKLISNCHQHFRRAVGSLPPNTKLLFNGISIVNRLSEFGGVIVEDPQSESHRDTPGRVHHGTINIGGRLFEWAAPEKSLRSVHPSDCVEFCRCLRQSWGSS